MTIKTNTDDQMSRAMPTEEFMTDVEVAARLRVSVSIVRTWRRLKKGPPFHRIGRLVRYRRADLNSWIEARRNEHEEAA